MVQEVIHEKIKLFLRSLVTSLFPGDFPSNRKGARGVEPMETREYRPGDDYKAIDYALSIKMKKRYVRLKREEKTAKLIFLIDRSKSGEFGTSQRKEDLQALLVDAFVYAGAHEGCQTAFVPFTDQVELEALSWPPKFHSIIRACQDAEEVFRRKPKGKLTGLSTGLNWLNRRREVSRSLVFLVSDFISPLNYFDSLSLVSLRHDLIPLVVRDKKEEELPKFRGFADIEDLETGQTKYLNLSKGTQQSSEYLKLFKKLNLDWVKFFTDETLEELGQKLRIFFEQRKRRRRRWV